MSTSPVSEKRLIKALALHGMHLQRRGDILTLSRQLDDGMPVQAEILLPPELPLELKAAQQLMQFAAVRHPHGGQVCKACATPDFHPGSTVPVGSVLVSSPDLVLPQAVGTDINCGMRLHVFDVPLSQFLAKKAQLLDLLRQDLLHAQRDLPTTPQAMTALFAEGLPAFWRSMRATAGGWFGKMDFAQLQAESERLYPAARVAGNAEYAPPALQDQRRGVLRDPGLGTIGSGNHFVEFLQVESVLDGRRAWDLQVRKGQLGLMIHSGSRDVGFYVGQRWMDQAKAAWPAGLKHPASGLYALHGPLAEAYLQAMHAAAHYADANRALLAEMVRLRVRQVFGAVEMPLVCDVPHNIVLRENGLNVHRKGATPAHHGQPLLIPGSMGDTSYLLDGLGNERFAHSASHGAGRAVTRNAMRWQAKQGQDVRAGMQFECITLKEERRVEEAPAAYKPIGPVIRAQVEQGLVQPIAALQPLLTFKA